MSKPNKNCQSCGMPHKSDKQGGGTDADGSTNLLYCSYCYVDGKYTHDGPVEVFQDFCKEKMIEGGHSKFTSWLFTRGMKRLDRWKN